MTDILNAVDPETLFPARPGGMVDTVRKQRAAEQAQADSLSAAPEAPVKVREIPVRPVSPDLGSARAITLSSSYPVAQLLPYDPDRRNAVILAVDNDVYISGNEGIAQDVSGSTTSTGAFYLPKGIAVPIYSTAPYWVACTTTGSVSRISVMINKDSA